MKFERLKSIAEKVEQWLETYWSLVREAWDTDWGDREETDEEWASRQW